MIERYLTSEMKKQFSEEKKFEYMLKVEKTVAHIQASEGVIPLRAAKEIQKKAKLDLKRIYEIEKETKHDVIAFVSQIAETVGDSGKYIHFALTSSDVLDTALSLQISEGLQIVLDEVDQLEKTLFKLIDKHQNTICVGRTHGIIAEPTTFGFKLAGFLSEIKRARARLDLARQNFRICKLSGAVGTSSALNPIIEIRVAESLDLTVEAFATQVIPRDRHAEVLMGLVFLAAALERLAIEFRHLQRTEVNEVIEGFSSGQKGSSAMPHKKNPISAENISGLARLIKGYAWTSLENIPLWHERDISHSSNERIILPDSICAAHYMVRRMNQLVQKIYIDKDRMKKNVYQLGGAVFSSHLLLYLIDKTGWSREKCYKLIQKLSHELKENESLESKIIKDKEIRSMINSKEIRSIMSGEKHIKAINSRFNIYRKQLK